MLKFIRNSVLLLSGAILVIALALVLGLLTNAPTPSVAQRPTLPPASSNPPRYPNLDAPSVAQLTKDWLVFENQPFGFRIKYPPNFFTREWPVEKDVLYYVSFIDQKWKNNLSGEIPDTGLVLYRNPQGVGLQEWFRAHSGSFTPQ